MRNRSTVSQIDFCWNCLTLASFNNVLFSKYDKVCLAQLQAHQLQSGVVREQRANQAKYRISILEGRCTVNGSDSDTSNARMRAAKAAHDFSQLEATNSGIRSRDIDSTDAQSQENGSAKNLQGNCFFPFSPTVVSAILESLQAFRSPSSLLTAKEILAAEDFKSMVHTRKHIVLIINWVWLTLDPCHHTTIKELQFLASLQTQPYSMGNKRWLC